MYAVRHLSTDLDVKVLLEDAELWPHGWELEQSDMREKIREPSASSAAKLRKKANDLADMDIPDDDFRGTRLMPRIINHNPVYFIT